MKVKTITLRSFYIRHASYNTTCAVTNECNISSSRIEINIEIMQKIWHVVLIAGITKYLQF